MWVEVGRAKGWGDMRLVLGWWVGGRGGGGECAKISSKLDIYSYLTAHLDS